MDRLRSWPVRNPHLTRKRLIGVQRDLKAAGEPFTSCFEILNLGKYERQFFAGIDPTLPEEQRRAISLQKEEHYLTLILNAYKAERTFQTPPFHGRKSGTLVVIGPIDAPVTEGHVHEAVEAARKLHVSRVDVLGFEFEMGIVPHAQDQARAKGINLRCAISRRMYLIAVRSRRARWCSTTWLMSRYKLKGKGPRGNGEVEGLRSLLPAGRCQRT